MGEPGRAATRYRTVGWTARSVKLSGLLRRDQRAGMTLIVVSGAPGTGKSTIAAAVAADLGWPLLAIDPIKEALADVLRLGRQGSHGGESGSQEPLVPGPACHPACARVTFGPAWIRPFDAHWSHVRRSCTCARCRLRGCPGQARAAGLRRRAERLIGGRLPGRARNTDQGWPVWRPPWRLQTGPG